MRKWKLDYIDITLLEESEVNANQMTDADFEQLVKNIKRSGGLSSAIGCYKRASDQRFVIFSGHHRYRAAVKLRMKDVPVCWCEETELEEDEKIALQLSHNSLHGTDNKSVLAKLFEQIHSIDFKEFAHVDVSEISGINVGNISFSAESEHYSVSLILYKKDIETLNELLELVDEKNATSDYVILADGDKNEEQFLELVDAVRKKYNIKSCNIAFQKILELAKIGMEV